MSLLAPIDRFSLRKYLENFLRQLAFYHFSNIINPPRLKRIIFPSEETTINYVWNFGIYAFPLISSMSSLNMHRAIMNKVNSNFNQKTLEGILCFLQLKLDSLFLPEHIQVNTREKLKGGYFFSINMKKYGFEF